MALPSVTASYILNTHEMVMSSWQFKSPMVSIPEKYTLKTANLTECVLGHKLRDLGPSLTYVILCKVLGFPCMSHVDSCHPSIPKLAHSSLACLPLLTR